MGEPSSISPTDRRLASVVVADVVGYSRMMEADESETLRALAEARATVIEPLVRECSGRIVKLLGDGLLLEFASVVRAVDCSIRIQRQMREANAPLPDLRRIVFRIGINLGDIVGQGEDIFGDGVNIAARLEQLAEPGGICVSGKVFDEIQGKITVPTRDLGAVKLKNIQNPVRAYAIDISGPAAQIDPLAAPANASREFTTIVVMPFANLSGRDDQSYFADGITEDLVTELSKHRDLSVVARSTAFAYKDQPVNAAELGRKLGADVVVTGGIRLAGQHVRATVQLVDAYTGRQVFAERFDRPVEDIFAVQDEIVDAIIGRLFFNLQTVASTARSRNPTTSVSAYTSWLRAGDAWRNGDEATARQHMHDAAAIDPAYAPALASLSLMYAYWRFSEPARETDQERKRLSIDYARLALRSGKSDPFVLTSVAACFLLAGAMKDALRYSEIALAMSPRDINVQVARGMVLSYAGSHDEGLSLVRRACSFEPLLPPTFVSSLGDCCYLSREFESALEAYRSPIDPPPFFRLNEGACLAQLGRIEEAKQAASELPADFDAALYARITAEICSLNEDADLWTDGLRNAGVAV
ncbi:adenylate/guanylate cyclase domain-containing protein [Sinorhizobium sp. 7-81]|uniref:adenylate/guanylate cyclase domain-containing protein n=1 Tax=Sinorhizobium sp. 8-89 TaxID=3049089 RepID=UPI0024C2E462|nr:adenylate/guanylate cyclase domain-containing protein [Sinorhizobium sp. 8-89]MDK1489745.1 adenylate/guanylate cyclase domain-containing protein [Sinorhizobium sp. 8-89]